MNGFGYASKPWLAHYPDQAPASITYPHIPLHRLLEKAARDFPDAVAVNFLGKKLSYCRLLSEVNHFARALADLGVIKGDRVGLMLPNCPQAVIAYYAVLRLGAVAVQINPMYVERELQFQLRDSGAETIVVLDLLYPKVKAVKNKTGLKNIVVARLGEYLPFAKRVLLGLKQRWEKQKIHIGHKPGLYFFEQLIRDRPFTPPEVDVKASDLALLQYTGGTTGTAKGAMLTHRNLVANVMQVKAWMLDSQPGKEKMLCVLPFFHVYGMTVAMNLAIALAAEMIVLPRFEIKQVLDTIDKLRPTYFPGAPTMYIAVNTNENTPKHDISSIRACISGSAALPSEVQETFERLTGGKLVEGYGLTEASPVTHCNPMTESRKNGTIGVPLADTECKIVDLATGEEVQVGEVGELLIKGPQVMSGYWRRPEETAAALREGWLYTGDLAKMDQDGYFSIVDRKKDMIIAGGFNIYPREIEEILYQHPKVKEAAAVGVPDPYRGETVKVFLALHPGETCSDQEIIEFCRGRMAAFKVPRLVEFRPELPKSIVGKVLKRKLLESKEGAE